MKAFRIKDLMINVVAQRGSGAAGMPGPDDDITDFPPHLTPVIMVAQYSPRFRAIGQFAGNIERLSPDAVNKLSIEAGNAAVAGALFRTALCAEDSPTCAANQIISPVATLGASLRFDDLVMVKGLLTEAVEGITELENSRLELAHKQADELIPKLEGAIEELKMR